MMAETPIYHIKVSPDWIDYNGHMGDFAYGIVFSDAATAYMDRIGIDEAHRSATAATLYTLDSRISFLKECHLGETLSVELYILAADRKRMHVFMRMLNGQGQEVALSEQMLMYISRADGTPKARDMPDEIRKLLDADVARDAGFERPAWLSRPIGLRK